MGVLIEQVCSSKEFWQVSGLSLEKKKPVYCSNPPSFVFKLNTVEECMFTSGQLKFCLRNKTQTMVHFAGPFLRLNFLCSIFESRDNGNSPKLLFCMGYLCRMNVLLFFRVGCLKSSSHVSELFSSVCPGCLENEADVFNRGVKSRSGDFS